MSLVEALLVVVGAVLVLLTFGLAFTIYGEVCFVAGIACLLTAAVLFGRRVRALGRTPPGQQALGHRRGATSP